MKVKLLLGVMLTMFMAGCSYIPKPNFLHHRDTDYLSAKSSKPLIIPPGISSNAIHTAYPVSEHAYEGQPKQVSILPPGIEK